jgi:hypothetical protein
MKKLTITKNRFLDWYYESGQDSEIVELKFDLAERIIEQLRSQGVANISVQDLFDACNPESIRLNFTEQGTEDDYDIELGDLGDYEITLK